MENPSSERAAQRRNEGRRRVELLRVLIGICRRIERLQGSAEARAACRQVAKALADLVGRERARRAGVEA
ncbi:MAG TPA: hypothetical protein VHE13_00750 [Opitutus sp.]|nr:hypothetical protein [Opitutus sp.]